MFTLFPDHYWTPRPGCPRLFLAPMEGLNDRPWRIAYAECIGGFDEACTEFIRMPAGGHAKSLARAFDPGDTTPLPQAAQIMADDPQAAAAMAQELERRGAWRIDLNCGCPSHTVVGKGAGSSLLKSPQRLFEMVQAIDSSVAVPVTVKMRSGYSDEQRFAENLAAAESAGASFITLHPRTREQGYRGQARWDLVARAKQLCRLPIVASGDVTDTAKAHELYQMSGCDGIMIGRGAFRDPWLFWRVRAHFSGQHDLLSQREEAQQLERLLQRFLSLLDKAGQRAQTGRLKQLLRFLAQRNDRLAEQLPEFLGSTGSAQVMLDQLIALWKRP